MPQILPPLRNAQTWTPASATQTSPESTARWESSSKEHYDRRQHLPDHHEHHPDHHEHNLQVRQLWTPPTQFLPSPGPTKAKAGGDFYSGQIFLIRVWVWVTKLIRKGWQTITNDDCSVFVYKFLQLGSAPNIGGSNIHNWTSPARNKKDIE